MASRFTCADSDRIAISVALNMAGFTADRLPIPRGAVLLVTIAVGAIAVCAIVPVLLPSLRRRR